MRARRWFAAVVVVVSLPAVALAEVTVTVSPGTPVADHISCPAQAAASALAKGPNGDSLIVWQNELDAFHADAVMAGRVAADGTLRDPLGIFVAANTLGTSRPVAAFDGTLYLVAWVGDAGVMAARIAADGTLLDPAPIMIGATASGFTTVTVAASPGQFLVAWVATGAVVAARVDATGAVLDSVPVTLDTASFVRSGPAAAFGGTDYAIVWNQNGIQAARVTTAGALVAPGKVDLVADTTGFTPDPAITFSGTEYFIAWNQGATKHMRVSTTLSQISAPNYNNGAGAAPAVSFDGTNYIIAAERTTNTDAYVDMERVSATEQYYGVNSLTLPINGGFGRVSSVYNGTQHLIAFEADGAVRAVRVASDGTVADSTPLLIAQTSNSQTFAQLAYDGVSSYLVAWADTRDTGDRTSVVVSTVDGTTPAAGGGAVVRSNIENSGGLAIARARAPGSTGLVVWHEGFPEAIRAARISSAGEIMDPNGFPIAVGTEIEDGSLTVACTSDTCMAVWEDSSFNVFGVRVSLATGAAIDNSPLPISSGISPRIAASSDSFVLGLSSGAAYRVATSGQPTPITIPPREGLRSWDIAWDGTAFTYAWSEATSSGKIALRVAHLDAMGAMVGEPATIASLDASVIVSVASDGSQSIVTFYPWLFLPPVMAPDFIYAARYTNGGEVLDPDGVKISIDSSRVVASAGGVGAVVVAEQSSQDGVTTQLLHFVSITGDNPNGPDGGGCCDTGGRSPDVASIVLGFVVLRRRRRRM